MLKTEMRNEKTMHIDKMDSLSIAKVINEENMYSVNAIDAALPQIAKAIDAVADALKNGGRLIYVGCGTSGRLAVADAAECPPTFGVDPELISAIMAGGINAIVRPSEDIEDMAAAGKNDITAKNLTPKDVVMGISAAGNASYVYSAMLTAKEAGCTTISLSSNQDCKIHTVADIAIFVDTGAEVITGSTRMKAGNAQKMILNMISTGAMIKYGRVYENMMIYLKPTNIKLRRRMIEIVSQITHFDDAKCEQVLEECGWHIPNIIEKYNL